MSAASPSAHHHPNFHPTFTPPSATTSSPPNPITVSNPATLQPLGTITATLADDVTALVSHANERFRNGSWRRADAQTRFTVLTKAAELLRERLPRLVELEVAQTGRPIREMRAQLGRVGEWFDYL